MKVLRTDRTRKDFYELLGPVFGARSIEKETKDRFYDDAGKSWYVIPGHAAASVLSGSIRNFWADTDEAACGMLVEMLRDYEKLSGIVPMAYESALRSAGFAIQKHRKNFLEVYFERHARTED